MASALGRRSGHKADIVNQHVNWDAGRRENRRALAALGMTPPCHREAVVSPRDLPVVSQEHGRREMCRALPWLGRIHSCPPEAAVSPMDLTVVCPEDGRQGICSALTAPGMKDDLHPEGAASPRDGPLRIGWMEEVRPADPSHFSERQSFRRAANDQSAVGPRSELILESHVRLVACAQDQLLHSGSGGRPWAGPVPAGPRVKTGATSHKRSTSNAAASSRKRTTAE